MPLRMVFRKPASTAPYTVAGELGHVSQEVPFFSCSALQCGPGQSHSLSLKTEGGLPSSCSGISSPTRAARSVRPQDPVRDHRSHSLALGPFGGARGP